MPTPPENTDPERPIHQDKSLVKTLDLKEKIFLVIATKRESDLSGKESNCYQTFQQQHSCQENGVIYQMQ